MPKPPVFPVAAFTEQTYLSVEATRATFERLLLAAYRAAGSPYSATLSPLAGALWWLEQEAASLDLPWARWLLCWRQFLDELDRAGLVDRGEVGP